MILNFISIAIRVNLDYQFQWIHTVTGKVDFGEEVYYSFRIIHLLKSVEQYQFFLESYRLHCDAFITPTVGKEVFNCPLLKPNTDKPKDLVAVSGRCIASSRDQVTGAPPGSGNSAWGGR